MTILVVDDHGLMRQGLAKVLKLLISDCEVLESSNGVDALEKLKSIVIDLTFLDVQMPIMNGLETLKRIKEWNPASKVIMLTQFDEAALISYCLLNGANAFLLKNGDLEEIKLAISRVLRDDSYYSPFVMDVIKKRLSNETKFADLDISLTEFRILSLLKTGAGTKAIANNLGLSVYTVESYRKDLLKKTNVKNVAELIYLACRTGIFPK